MSNAVINILAISFGAHVCISLEYIFKNAVLIGKLSALVDIAKKDIPKWLHHFILLPLMEECFSCFRSLTILSVVFSFFIVIIRLGSQQFLIVPLICNHSPDD